MLQIYLPGKLKNLRLPGALFLLGAFAGFALTRQRMDKKQQTLLNQIHPARMNNSKYHYTNPLLGYSIPELDKTGYLKDLKKSLNEYTLNAKQTGKADKISVYFRDLNLGRWVGIDENQEYDPASMLKVVLMVAYYKKSEDDPFVLSQNLAYTKELDAQIKDVPFQTPSELAIGKQYSVEDLINRMIITSDNGAKNALLANLDESSLNEAYTDLGEKAPAEGSNYTISARAYSIFFRVLYNSTYLKESLSEKALKLLSQTTFSNGLVAGIPQGIQISHKYGEKILSGGQKSELHDCGIIFHPGHPYALCIMTSGDNPNDLAGIIKDLSQIAYREVSREK